MLYYAINAFFGAIMYGTYILRSRAECTLHLVRGRRNIFVTPSSSSSSSLFFLNHARLFSSSSPPPPPPPPPPQSIFGKVKNIASAEGTIIKEGLELLQKQTMTLSFILTTYTRRRPTTLSPTSLVLKTSSSSSTRTAAFSLANLTLRERRFITRASLDLVKAIPWVPFLVLVPGSLLVFLAAATKLPFLLPSTFVIARKNKEEEEERRVQMASAVVPPGTTTTDQHNNPTYLQLERWIKDLSAKSKGKQDTITTSYSPSSNNNSTATANAQYFNNVTDEEIQDFINAIRASTTAITAASSSSSSASEGSLLAIPVPSELLQSPQQPLTLLYQSERDALYSLIDRISIEDSLLLDENLLQIGVFEAKDDTKNNENSKTRNIKRMVDTTTTTTTTRPLSLSIKEQELIAVLAQRLLYSNKSLSHHSLIKNNTIKGKYALKRETLSMTTTPSTSTTSNTSSSSLSSASSVSLNPQQVVLQGWLLARQQFQAAQLLHAIAESAHKHPPLPKA